MYLACGTIESFLLLFYANSGPNNGATSQNSGWGFFHGGCRAITGDVCQGVHGRTNNALAAIGDFTHASANLGALEPTIHRPAPSR